MIRKLLLGTCAALICQVAVAQTTLTTLSDFTVTDTHGDTHHAQSILDDGQWMLIDFFAYWCGPCMDLADDFGRVHADYGCNTGDVYTISVEYEGTDAQVIAFEDANGGQGPAASGQEGGGGAVHGAYGISAFPTFILVDPDGNIVEQDIWPASEAIFKSTLASYGIQEKSCDVASSVDAPELGASINLYPNPASDIAQISIKLTDARDLQIELFNVAGERVVESVQGYYIAGNNQVQFDISTLPAGQYFAKVSSVDGANKAVPFTIAR